MISTNEIWEMEYVHLLRNKVVIRDIIQRHPSLFQDILEFLIMLEGVMKEIPDAEIVNRLIAHKETKEIT